jgi:hypothetical protein
VYIEKAKENVFGRQCIQRLLDRFELLSTFERDHLRSFPGKNYSLAFSLVLRNRKFSASLSGACLCLRFPPHTAQKATTDDTKDLYVIVYNGLGSLRGSTVQLPVSSNATYRVARLDSPAEQAQYVRSAGTNLPAKYILSFDTGLLPPVGAAVFQISTLRDNDHSSYANVGLCNIKTANTVRSCVLLDTVGRDHVEVTNGQLAVRFDRYVSRVSAALAILPWP